jgi:hypothetical protein
LGGKIWESIAWGPEQEVSLSQFDDWKQEYVRIEDGEDVVDAIDRQEGWTTKRAIFHAELIDLNCDSRVGYVPSKLALQMVEDDWVAQRPVVPIVTELTVQMNKPGMIVLKRFFLLIGIQLNLMLVLIW